MNTKESYIQQVTGSSFCPSAPCFWWLSILKCETVIPSKIERPAPEWVEQPFLPPFCWWLWRLHPHFTSQEYGCRGCAYLWTCLQLSANACLGGELLGHRLTSVNFLRICQTISCRSSAIVIPTARPKCASFTAFLVNTGYFPLSVQIPAVLAGECGISPQGGCEFAFS